MLNIYVYATQPEQANKAVEQLRVAGADQVEVLAELKIPASPPKDNRYIFICETPAEKLAQLAPTVLPEEDYVQALTEWFDAQYPIVQTVIAHKKRSILIPANQLATTNALVGAINTQWALNLTDVNKDAAKQQNPAQPEPLLGYLVQNLIEQTPPLQALENQINALAGINGEPLHEIDALTGYRVLRQQQTELVTQNQRLAIEAEELRKEKSELTAERDAQANATKEATEEAELLLLQLHQVQEELENYFLKNQEAEAKLAKQHARWQRLLEKNPDYIDTEHVQVELIDPTTQTLRWIVRGLEGHGFSKDYLEFDTFIESGILGIRFNKTNSRDEPTLKNWPASCKGETIDCIPAGRGNVMRQRALALRELSTSDWKLLNTLPQLIKQHLKDTSLDAKLCATVADSTSKFLVSIKALPHTIRYDAITLKSNKVNPDYEHLWIELQDASFGKYNWPKFEFRLGAASIVHNKFSDLPKLEIPKIDERIIPFNSWFEESHDDFGGKFELRFDIKKEIFDVITWNNLDDNDQSLIESLTGSLVTALSCLEKENIELSRNWQDWIKLAEGVRKTFKLNHAHNEMFNKKSYENKKYSKNSESTI